MSAPTAHQVIARRRAWQADLVDVARAFVRRLDPALDVRAAAVFGSVARGDFHTASDIDLLLVAETIPARAVDRLRVVGFPAGDGVEPVVWTSSEHAAQRARRNPIAVEADAVGIWLLGGPTTAPRERTRQPP